jgi:molybdopterin molybdotransferase
VDGLARPVPVRRRTSDDDDDSDPCGQEADDHRGDHDCAHVRLPAGDAGSDDHRAAGDHDPAADDRVTHDAAVVAVLPTFEEAQARVLERIRPLAAERVALDSAAGRVTAGAAVAAVDLPSFASSAMDGFAVRAADAPGTLPVVGQIAAGSPSPRALAPGEAMAISTGGVVPDGADAIAPLEDVVRIENTIEIAAALSPGAYVRPRGGDARAGDVVVEAGVLLGAAQIGALGAAGVGVVEVSRRPRVAVLATGSELARPGEPLRPGQIYEANGAMLAAALAAVGADVSILPTVPDDEAAHREALERGLEADVLVTSGGVSVGPHDLVRRIAAELGVEEVFWQVAIKPGKPVSFGVRGATLVFGLPGNPVSSLVACELFVKPAIRALQGIREPLPPFERATLGSALRRNAGRDELVRAVAHRLPHGVMLEPLSGQESHMIVRAAGADALVLVPRGEGELEAGHAVSWLRLHD